MSGARPIGGAGPLTLALSAIWRERRGAVILGVATSLAAFLAGAILAGLAGWWIGAAAASATLGAAWILRATAVGAALSRAAARYAERLSLHAATLSFLAWLRVRLFEAAAAAPWRAMLRLRRGVALSRLTADVDALDGLYIRIAAPAAAAAFGCAAVALVVIVAAPTAGTVAAAVAGVAVLAAAGLAALAIGAHLGARPARRRAAALEALRVRFIDLQAARAELAAAGRIAAQKTLIHRAADAARSAAMAQRRLDLALGAFVAIAAAGAAALAFYIAAVAGAGLAGTVLAAVLALALPEAIAPLRRAGMEIGRTRLAARRAAPALAAAEAAGRATGGPASPRAGAPAPRAELGLDVVDARIGDGAPARFAVAPGEIVALQGPSGAGKSTLLAAIAGLSPPDSGEIRLGGAPLGDWPEDARRDAICLLPQRVELLSGTIGDNLRLAAPTADDQTLWRALEAAAAAAPVRRAGGLEAPVADGGTGFSGGETRRIALARLLLRRPALALLDEPTEGLDPDTARATLAGALDWLSGSAVVMASHRADDLGRAGRIIRLTRTPAPTP